MCTNCHYVFNKYIRQRILIPCGKCPACLQEKANARAARIRSSFGPNDIGLFVTLTYDNDHVPCIHLDELKEHSDIPVYRGHSMTAKKIGSLWCSDFPMDFDQSKLVKNIRNSVYADNLLGVTFYKDVQNFFKRLRINLYRKHNENISIRYFATTEYGETYFRPHSHLVLIIPKESLEIVRACIYESWKMCDIERLRRGVEIARDVAKYVASYVNSPVGLPKILQSVFKQKHANSKLFGVSNSVFSLAYIVSCADKNDMSYSLPSSSQLSCPSSVLLPKYVINRYFPLFKGFSRIPPSEVANVLQRPSKLPSIIQDASLWRDRLIKSPDGKLIKDFPIHTIVVQQQNAARDYINYFKNIGILKSVEDYYRDYERVWNCYHSTKLRYWYLAMVNSQPMSPLHHYDNVNELACGVVRSDLSELNNLNEIPHGACHLKLRYLLNKNMNLLGRLVDPNNQPLRVQKSLNLAQQFDATVKRKKVFVEVEKSLYHDI